MLIEHCNHHHQPRRRRLQNDDFQERTHHCRVWPISSESWSQTNYCFQDDPCRDQQPTRRFPRDQRSWLCTYLKLQRCIDSSRLLGARLLHVPRNDMSHLDWCLGMLLASSKKAFSILPGQFLTDLQSQIFGTYIASWSIENYALSLSANRMHWNCCYLSWLHNEKYL